MHWRYLLGRKYLALRAAFNSVGFMLFHEREYQRMNFKTYQIVHGGSILQNIFRPMEI